MTNVHASLPVMAEDEEGANSAVEMFSVSARGINDAFSAYVSGKETHENVLNFTMKVLCFVWNEGFRYGKHRVLSEDFKEFMSINPEEMPKTEDLQ